MKYANLYLVIALIACGYVTRAQNYAVQSAVQIVPPYSVYLSDYATGGNEKLRVILIQKDLSRPVYQLRLVMNVELDGRIIMRTSRNYNPPPITLNPGIPTIIAGSELAPYVDSRNIDFIGYSKDQYERTKALPEGSYRIMFTAYDYQRQDQQVSNEGNGFAYLSKNEPPMINFPACGSHIPMKTPQQIVFSWMPRNTSSPNSAQETEYEFALYETRPVGRNPNDVVLTTQPLYKIRTDLKQLVYGPTEPMLLENMTYVWRVQAIDLNGRDAYRNNGYSEVCTFTYGGSDPTFNIGTVKGLQAVGETDTRGKIWWDKGDFDSYKIYYKKTGEGYEWFTSEVANTEYKIFDLEADKEYEVRLQAKKDGSYSPYSDIIKFRTRIRELRSCGDASLVPVGLGNPLMQALGGMTITASGRPVRLLTVTSTGQPGWYKGIGTVVLPYLGATYHVKFERLYIDENREAKEGQIDVISEGIEKMISDQLAEQKKRQTGNLEAQQQANRDEWSGTDFYDRVFVYDKDIDQVIVDASQGILIKNDDGTTATNTEVRTILTDQPTKAIIIQDKSGDQFVVQKDKTTGEVKVTKVEGGGLGSGNTSNVDTGTTTVDVNPIKDKIIVLILEQFEEEIGAWLRMNGKGGEADDEVLLALELPECFKRDVGQLKYIRDKTIPYFKAHPAELRGRIEANQTNKTLFDKIAGLFKSKDDVAWPKVHADDQQASRNATCKALMDDIAPLASFYDKAKPLLTKDAYKDAIKKIRAIYEFFKVCNNEGWGSYNGEGIVPYCFWRDQNVSKSLYYSNADLPFTAGLIDGVYKEAEGIYHLPQLAKDLSKMPGKLLYAYTKAYFDCRTTAMMESVEEYEYVLAQLEELEDEDGLWAWSKEKYYESKSEDLVEYLKDCKDADELRETVDQLYEIVTSWEEIKTLYGQVSQRLSTYFSMLEKADNIGRYERGRLIVPVVTTVLTLGAAAVPKVQKLKNVLRGLKEASEGNWKKITEGISKLVTKGASKFSTFKNISKLPDNILSKIEAKGWVDDVLTKLDADLVDDAFKIKLTNEVDVVDGWGILRNTPYKTNPRYLDYVNSLKNEAKFGTSVRKDYRKTFFESFPELTESDYVVHHSVEQQILDDLPGLITESEMNSLRNLRGIPKTINSDVHLSSIRKEWNKFYRENPTPTKQQLLEKAKEIDDMFGNLFYPPIR